NIFIVVNIDSMVLIGRHHKCDVVLAHPSVSRFHLRIFCHPSSRSLSLTDLSSVHGTWLNGTKLQAGVSVLMNEGDTFTVGVLSRVIVSLGFPLLALLIRISPLSSNSMKICPTINNNNWR
ncbi:hypothetical protein HN873_044506, partial [Arachis hypogaea]